MADVDDGVEVLEDSLNELLAKEQQDSWKAGLEAVQRISDLYCQAEYDFWTLDISVFEGDSCPLLGKEFENSAGVLLDNTQTPVSFEYVTIVLHKAKAVMQNWGDQYEGKQALKILENPFTRQPIRKLKPVRVFDTSDIFIE